MGQKNENGARQILANGCLMRTVLAMMLTVCVLGRREKLLWWFGAGETTCPYALSYMTIYLCGTFFTLMTTGMNQFIICQGFAKVGMKAVVIDIYLPHKNVLSIAFLTYFLLHQTMIFL